jgi:beta-glucosidase
MPSASGNGMPSFPDGFLLGAATAGHQVEGGNVNSDIWKMEWAKPSMFTEPSGDACDHDHRYPEDVATLASLGVNAYRFSVERSRVEPEEGYFSRATLDHYRRMVAKCHEHGVPPVVTYNHFSVPRWFSHEANWNGLTAVLTKNRYRGDAHPMSGIERMTGAPLAHGASSPFVTA